MGYSCMIEHGNIPPPLLADTRVVGYRTQNGLVVSYEGRGYGYGDSADQSVNELRVEITPYWLISVHTVNSGHDKRYKFVLGKNLTSRLQYLETWNQVWFFNHCSTLAEKSVPLFLYGHGDDMVENWPFYVPALGTLKRKSSKFSVNFHRNVLLSLIQGFTVSNTRYVYEIDYEWKRLLIDIHSNSPGLSLPRGGRTLVCLKSASDEA